MDHFDFPFLSNLIYFMMFRTNTNEKIWKSIIDATLDQDDILPMNCYKPYKFSKFYLEHHFPEWNLEDYVDRFFYSERYFNQS